MATPLQSFRQKYPQYDKISDEVLADRLYEKFYKGKIGREDYFKRLGVPRQPKPGMVNAETYNPDRTLPKGFAETPQDAPVGITDYASEAARSVGRGAGKFIASVPRGIASAYEATFGDMNTLNENPLYQTGQGADKAADNLFPQDPRFKDSWTSTIGEGAGSLLPLVGTGAFGVGGRIIGWTMGGAAGADEATQRAIEAGATPDQVGSAAQQGIVPGMIDMLPVERLLKVPSGFLDSVIKQAGLEGGQEGVQQVLQNLIEWRNYNPDQEMTEGVLENATVGAIVGGAAGGANYAVRGQPQQEPQPNPEGLPEITVTPSPDSVERMPDSVQVDILRGANYDDEDIANMSPRERMQKAMELRDRGAQPAPRTEPAPNAPAARSGDAGVEIPALTEPQAETWDDQRPRPRMAPEITARSRGEATATMQQPQRAQAGPGQSRMVPPDPGMAPRAPGGRFVEIGPRPDQVTPQPALTDQQPEVWDGPPDFALRSVRERGQLPAQGAPQLTPNTPIPLDVARTLQQATPPPPAPPLTRRLSPAELWQPPATEPATPEGIGRERNYRVTGAPIQTQAQVDPSEYMPGQPEPPPNTPAPESPWFSPRAAVQYARERAAEQQTTPPDPAPAPPAPPEPTRLDVPSFGRTREDVMADTEAALAPRTDKFVPERREATLLEFIGERGGLKDFRGELRSRDLDRHFVPGKGRIVRQGGMGLDYAREAAVEAGYLPEGADINDLMDAIDEEVRGRPTYPRGFDLETHKANNERGKTLFKARRAVERAMRQEDFAGISLNEQEMEAAAQYVADGMDVANAVDTAVMDNYREDYDGEELGSRPAEDIETYDPGPDSIPFEDFPDAAEQRAPTAQQELSPPSEGRDRPEGEGVAGEPVAEIPVARETREEARDVSEEAGADNRPQAVIPGAERVGQGAIAQRRADAPLRPRANQKPADEGLFGDEKDQTDFFAQMPDKGRKKITARTMVELRRKIYEAEGWTRQAGESSARRIKDNYDVEFDAKSDRITATRKTRADEMPDKAPAGWEEAGTVAEDPEIIEALRADPELAARLEKRLGEFAEDILGHRVSLKLSGRYGAQGSWRPDDLMIWISAYSPDWLKTVRHEAMHALRDFGLLTKPEWSVLSREAKAKWMDDFNVRDRWEKHYRERTDLTDAQIDELLTEEAVAEAFAHHQRGNVYDGAVAKIFDKLSKFLKRAKNFLRGEGFQISEDVFNRIYGGEVKKRKDGSGSKRSFTFKEGRVVELKQMPQRYKPRNIPRSAKIESKWENLARGGRVFFESAADVLDRQPALKPLAKAIRQYYDQTQVRYGLISRTVRPVTDAIKALPRKAREKVMADFEEYMAHRESKRTADADAKYNAMSKEGQDLIDAWNKIADITGDQNQAVGVQVFDPKLGKMRPIGKLKRFFPRQLKQEVMEALANPQPSREWDQIVDTLMAEGYIQNPDDAKQYIKGQHYDYDNTDYGADFYAGIEKARTGRLPESFYDHSWNAAETYLHRWAQHLSRIEAFGQKSDRGEPDLFVQILKDVTEPETRSYIVRVANRIYEERFDTPGAKMGAQLNTIATGTQLGNPASALLNLTGGAGLTAGHYGGGNTLIALIRALQNPGRAVAMAKDLGVVTEDTFNVMNDMMQQGASRRLASITSGLLKYSGFTPAENFNRAVAVLSAQQFLKSALKHWNRRVDGRKSLQYIAFMQRNGFDYEKMLVENGTGPETSRFLRYAVNLSQGSYKIDNVPLWIDEPLGRFLFKYQKFGTQVNRAVWKNLLKPFYDSIFKGGEKVVYTSNGQKREARVRTFLPLLRFAAVMYASGEIAKELGSLLWGGGDEAPGWDEIGKVLEDDDTAAKMGILWERFWIRSLTAGTFGFFGNYAQMAADALDRQRYKNPLQPPGLGPVDAVLEPIRRYLEQGTLTAKDIDEAAQKLSSAYRVGSRTVLTQLSRVSEIEAAQKEVYRQDRAYIRAVGRRYAADSGIEAKQTTTSRIAKTPMSPINSQIVSALELGQAGRARAIRDQYLKTLKTDEERKKARNSISSSIRQNQPILIGSGSEEGRREFLAWAKQHVGPQNFERIKRVDKRYRDAARQLGLFKN